MKPIRIEMESFGSYADKAIIDFTRPKQNLFLITGNTGSGKSTIFDAMVFALYGEASANRDKKEGVVLQSQFATLEREPKVTFTFQEKGNLEYTIVRIPKHYRKAKRRSKNGNSLVLEQGSVEFRLPDGSVYAQRDVQSKIEEVVGLTKSQFMQVAMIAQGEFMDLLRADTKSKLEIFRKLFHTEIYRDMTDELKRRKDAKATDMARLRTQCLSELEHVRVFEEADSTETEAIIYYQEEYQKYKKELQNSLAKLDEFIAFLQEMCAFQKNDYDATKSQWEQVNASYEEQMKRLSLAQYISRAYEELEQAKQLQKELQSQSEQYKEKQNLVSLGRKTYTLFPFYQDKEDSRTRLAAYREEAEKGTKELFNCQKNRQALQEKKNQLEPEWKKQSDQYIKVMEKVNRALANFKSGKEKQREYLCIKQEYDKLSAEYTRLESEITAFEEKYKKEQEELQQLADAKVAVEKCRQAYEKARLMTQKYRQYQTMLIQLHDQREQCISKEKEYEQAKRDYLKVQEKYEHLQQCFFDNQAGILARQLEDGKPCPVCGSLSHPNVFHKNEIVIPTEQEVNQAKQAREDAAKMQMDKATEVSGTRSTYKQMLAQVITFSNEELGIEYEDCEDGQNRIAPLVCQQEQLEHTCRQELEVCERTVKRLLKLEKEVAKKEENLKNEKKKKEEISHQVQEYATQLAEQKAALAELKKQIPYENEAQAQQEAVCVKEDYERMKTNYNALEQQVQAANSQCESLSARKKKVAELIETEKCAVQKKTEIYEMQCEKLQLSETDFLQIKEQYSQEQIACLEQENIAYRQQCEEVEKTIVRTTSAIANQPKPEITRMQEELANREQLRARLEEGKTKKYHCLENNEKVLEYLLKKMKDRQETHKEYARIERLYQVASGQVKGQNKMDVETFVQRYYLQRALLAANQRFVKMSSGQFELTMKQVEDSQNARNEGLDLMVHSLVTDTYRDIKTLSGGESFMAALSLALGMADMIQNASSAIRLDMMFIDEGFGSLDEESRNQAVRILKELAGGQRLIGIISHVSELKQQIEEQLVVTKDSKGSRVKWEV